MFRISVWVYAFFLLACSVLPMAAQQPAAVSANAVVPSIVNFKGVLTDVNGKPLTGTVGVTFYLYQESQGGTPLWMETQNVQPDKVGHYSVALGSTSTQGLPANMFATGEARWLGVQVHGQDEQPRVLLMSVPYALKALDAETIGGKPASAFMMAPTSSSKSQPPVLPPGTITGSGTADFVPMFTGTTTIGNSKIFQTVGGNVGIATTTPAAKLDISGTGDVRDTLTLFPKSTHPTLSVHGTAFEVSTTGKVTFVSGQTFPGTGTVKSVGSGAGLTGGPITSSGTLSIATGGVTNAMLAHSSLTVSASSPLTGGGAVSLGGSTSLGLESCSSNQILEFVSGAWKCVNPATGTVTSITAGTGLTGGTITGSGTIAVNASVVPELATANSFINNNAISANNSSASLTVTNTSNGDAIDANGNGADFGVLINNAEIGIDAEGSFIPMLASSPSNGIEAVFAEASNDSSLLPAIYGVQEGTTTNTIGVQGVSSSAAGYGLYGVGATGNSTVGTSRGAGVWGDSSAGFGVVGYSDSNYAVAAQSSDSNGSGLATIIAFSQSSVAGDPVIEAVSTEIGGACIMDTDGNLSCTGSKSAVVPVDGGSRKVALYAEEAPENWFEDAGSAHLSNGEAVVNLEGVFAETINTDIDYHVFLTPNGDCKGLYIAQKTPTSFVVRELGGGTSSVVFDYRIMAKRKGYENIRLADRTRQFRKPPALTQPKTGKSVRLPSAREVREKLRARRVAQLSAPVVKH